MPADPETTAALGQLTTAVDRLGQKLDKVEEGSRESSRRIYARIDEHAAESRQAIARLSESLVRQETTLDLHRIDDAENFKQIRRSIGDGDADRGKLWRRVAWILGGLSAVGGGSWAALTKLLGGGGNG